MKFRRGAAVAAVAATGTYAQVTSAPAYSPLPGVTYTTVTYDDCESVSLETMITVTNGVTVTYCPECEASASATPTTPGHTTVYTTTYLSLCPTGTVPVTYTITESCSEATPTWTPGPSHIPQGYTVTVKDCTVCHSDLSKTSTIPVTITEPCGCEANEGTTVPPTKPAAATAAATPTGKPVQQISDGQVQNPTGNPVQQISDGQVQNPTGNPVQQISDGQVQNPTGAAATSKAPASGAASSAAPYPSTTAGAARPDASASVSGVDYGNTTNITPAPYEGAASTAGVASLLLAGVIGALAYFL